MGGGGAVEGVERAAAGGPVVGGTRGEVRGSGGAAGTATGKNGEGVTVGRVGC